ncbi:MAG: hypothetical protein RBR34_12805 [Rhodospirillaceae bacterium]|nr:hypothetical protein [Rhodospirillaceae bacterium]
MAQPRPRLSIRSAVTFISVIWILATAYQEFFAGNFHEFGFRTPEMVEKLNACTGTFSERYVCKDGLIIAKGQEDFLVWVEKAVWVFAPPALLFAFLGLFRRGVQKISDPGKNRPDGGSRSGNQPPPTDISRWRVR